MMMPLTNATRSMARPAAQRLLLNNAAAPRALSSQTVSAVEKLRGVLEQYRLTK